MNTFKSIALLAVILIALPTQAQDSFSSLNFTNSASSFRSHADGTVSFQFKNVPLRDVLVTFGVEQAGVLVDESVDKTLEQNVSYEASSVKLETAIAKLLKGARLRVADSDKGPVLTATQAGEKLAGQVTSMRQKAFSQLLDQPSQLSMMHTPLEMVVQFAGGMSQAKLQIDYVALRRARISPQTMVTIRPADTLRESLTEMLKPHGLEIDLVGDTIVITVSQTAAGEKTETASAVVR